MSVRMSISVNNVPDTFILLLLTVSVLLYCQHVNKAARAVASTLFTSNFQPKLVAFWPSPPTLLLAWGFRLS